MTRGKKSREYTAGEGGEKGKIADMEEKEGGMKGDMDADMGDTVENDQPMGGGAKMDEDTSDMDNV